MNKKRQSEGLGTIVTKIEVAAAKPPTRRTRGEAQATSVSADLTNVAILRGICDNPSSTMNSECRAGRREGFESETREQI